MKVLLSDPEKAITALTFPLIIGVLVQNLNSLVDITWVSWLGASAVSGLSLVFPVYTALSGIGNGLGIGLSAAVSRDVGRRDREAACRAAGQTVAMAVAFSVCLSVPLLIFAEPIMVAFGAGDVLDESVDYAVPIFCGIFFLLLSQMMSGVLRGEGATKEAMWIQVAGALTNMVLDPILIYGVGWGVAGAAWATVVAAAVSSALGFVCYRPSRGMYVVLSRRYMRIDMGMQRDILAVGAPQAAELVIMSVFNIPMNRAIIEVGGPSLVGVYTTAWRACYMVLIPAQAMSGSIVPACSAEIGAGRGDLLRRAFRYGITRSVLYTAVLSVGMAALSPLIADAATAADDLRYLRSETETILLALAIQAPLFSQVFVGGAYLQATRRSVHSFLCSLLRNVVLVSVTVVLAMAGAESIWLWVGLVAVEVSGGALMDVLAYRAVRAEASKAEASRARYG